MVKLLFKMKYYDELTSEKLNLLTESIILWQCTLYIVSSVCSLSVGMEDA